MARTHVRIRGDERGIQAVELNDIRLAGCTSLRLEADAESGAVAVWLRVLARGGVDVEVVGEVYKDVERARKVE